MQKPNARQSFDLANRPKTMIIPAEPGHRIVLAQCINGIDWRIHKVPVVAWLIEDAATKLAITVVGTFDYIDVDKYHGEIALEIPDGSVYDPYRLSYYTDSREWSGTFFNVGKGGANE